MFGLRRQIVHGDLATRNVLLDEHFQARISDFGLAKQLYNNVVYQRRRKVCSHTYNLKHESNGFLFGKIPLPWRWMAPESLSSLEMSPASDVWSYGITLWEIFTLGKLPYASAEWNTQHEERLLQGIRLPQPSMASMEMYGSHIQ